MPSDIVYERLRENLLPLKMFTAESIMTRCSTEQTVSKEMSIVEVLNHLLGEEVRSRGALQSRRGQGARGFLRGRLWMISTFPSSRRLTIRCSKHCQLRIG